MFDKMMCKIAETNKNCNIAMLADPWGSIHVDNRLVLYMSFSFYTFFAIFTIFSVKYSCQVAKYLDRRHDIYQILRAIAHLNSILFSQSLWQQTKRFEQEAISCK